MQSYLWSLNTQDIYVVILTKYSKTFLQSGVVTGKGVHVWDISGITLIHSSLGAQTTAQWYTLVLLCRKQPHQIRYVSHAPAYIPYNLRMEHR